jgi:hypothetical protein
VIQRLRDEVIPVALDCAYLRHSDDEAGRLFRKLSDEALLNPPNPDGNRSRQGHYVASAGGTLLAAHNRRGARAVHELLDRGLERFRQAERADVTPALGEARRDPRFDRRLPAGGLALNAYTRILGWDESAQEGPKAPRPEFVRWNRERSGFDHLWVWPEELAGLVPPRAGVGHRWNGPKTLARRIARFHLVDNVRGEPPHYRADEVRDAILTCTLTREEGERATVALSGYFLLDASGDAKYPRGFRGGLRGEAVWNRAEKRWERVDLYAEGDTFGQGRWNPGAPLGAFRLGVAFEVVPDGFAEDVPPQGCGDLGRYRSP